MLEVANRTRTQIPPVDIAKIYRFVFPSGKMELSVAFVGNAFMQKTNKRYRGKDKTTDVLSFALEKQLSEILISIPKARADARAEHMPFAKKLEQLLIHGMLHIKGYDHERSVAEARRMQARERRIAQKL